MINSGPETFLVIEKAHGVARTAEIGIVGDDLALPLGIEQVPVRFDLGGVDLLGVVADDDAGLAVDVEQVLILRIDVVMFPLPPFRGIDDVRQHQHRCDRIERFGFIEDVVAGGHAVDVEIGQVFLRAPLRHQSLGHVGAPSVNPGDFDLGILPVELGEQHFKIGAAVENQLSFFLRRLKGFFPIRFPRVGRSRQDYPGTEEQAYAN